MPHRTVPGPYPAVPRYDISVGGATPSGTLASRSRPGKKGKSPCQTRASEDRPRFEPSARSFSSRRHLFPTRSVIKTYPSRLAQRVSGTSVWKHGGQILSRWPSQTRRGQDSATRDPRLQLARGEPMRPSTSSILLLSLLLYIYIYIYI